MKKRGKGSGLGGVTGVKGREGKEREGPVAFAMRNAFGPSVGERSVDWKIFVRNAASLHWYLGDSGANVLSIGSAGLLVTTLMDHNSRESWAILLRPSFEVCCFLGMLKLELSCTLHELGELSDRFSDVNTVIPERIR